MSARLRLRDLFRFWQLLGPAVLAAGLWPAISRALDRAQAERRVSGELDWPRGIFGHASCEFTEFSAPFELLRYWAGWLWAQMEAPQ